MRIAFLFLLILFSKNCFSNSIEEIIEVLKKKDFANLEHFIANIKPGTHCGEPDELRKRRILTDYREVVANVLLFTPTPNGPHEGDCNYYQINLITKGNEIIKYDFYSKNYSDSEIEKYKLLNHYLNEDEIKIFQKLYNENFYRKLDLNELFNISTVYGAHCGIVGVNPEERDNIESYISTGDHEKLFYLLTSPNFEKKLYGYEGFKILMDKGYIPSDKEKTIINGIKSFKGFVRTCGGCIFMNDGFSKLVIEITNQKPDTSVIKKVNIVAEVVAKDKSSNRITSNKVLTSIVFILAILLIIGLFYKVKEK